MKDTSPKIILAAWEFDLLWARMCGILQDHYIKNGIPELFPQTERLMIGFKDAEGKPAENEESKAVKGKDGQKKVPDRASLFSLINLNKGNLETHITLNYLYAGLNELKNARDSKQPDAEISMRSKFLKELFRFVGVPDVNKFRQTFIDKRKYTGYYYSNEENTLKTFSFELISWLPSKHRIFPFDSLVNLQGFPEFDPGITFKGNVTILKEAWTSMMVHGDSLLNITVKMPGFDSTVKKLSGETFFYGALAGVSPGQNLLNLEFVMLAADDKNAKSKLGIERYLNLRRNHFQISVSSKDLKSVHELQTNNVLIDKIKHLAGKKFRILSAGPSQVLIQSKFKIEEDYSATISVPEKDGNVLDLNCAILLNSINEGRVLVNAYKANSVMYSSTSFEFRNNSIKDITLYGHYSITDGSAAEKPYGSRFVMREDNSDFEVKAFRQAQANELDNNIVSGILKKELLAWLSEKKGAEHSDQSP